MLNETASSTEDRPALRPALRFVQQTEESLLHNELRQMVMTVFSIEREAFQGEAEFMPRDGVMLTGADSQLTAAFEGRLLVGSEEAYERLDKLFAGVQHLPLFRNGADGKHIIYAISGRIQTQTRPWWPNALLFVATIIAVLMSGTLIAIGEVRLENPQLAERIADNFFLEIWRGFPYAISILLILGAHELGHYFAARYHKLAVTLPYFIPAPLISPLGTFGAFIQLREPMRNRKVLLDVGAAGPLIGLLFAIPILFIGLRTSPVGPIEPGGVMEGNSLLYALMKTAAFGQFLPNGEIDVTLNQLAFAGWTGLLVTALNLIPIGQLDGGHILYSLLGDRARRLYYPLLGGMLLLVVLGADTWLFWLFLLFLFGRVYATPLDMITRLDRRRSLIAILGLIVFVVTFVPIPLSMVPEAGRPLPRESVEMLLPFAVGLLALWTARRR